MLVGVYDWAVKYNISIEALAELRNLMAPDPDLFILSETAETPEAVAQQAIRLAAPKHGVSLWRNNVGAVYTEDGRFIRFGLANDSKKVNKKIKSSDLIGITPRAITDKDVGKTFGIFTAIEVKPGDWKYKATAREVAQAAWLKLILKLGGYAKFARGPHDIWN